MVLKLNNVRVSFPDLFIPKPFKAGDVPKFKCTFLIPKGSKLDKEVEKAILAAGKASKWGAKAEKEIAAMRNNPNKFCYQDGDNKDYDGYAGMMALSAGSKTRPLVIDRDKSPLTVEDGKPYAGSYVNAQVELFGYNNSGNGISAGLLGVQFVKDGDAFSGSKPADISDFDEVEDDDSESLV